MCTCSTELKRRPGDPAALAEVALQRLVLASAAVSALSGPKEMSVAAGQAIEVAHKVIIDQHCPLRLKFDQKAVDLIIQKKRN